ncbi:hypothetical protein D3C73_1566530 [compost metagenome]
MLDAPAEINNLGVFAAQFDGGIGLRRQKLDGLRAGDYLLQKWNPGKLREG